MLFRCSFFRTQQLGSGPADIPRILVFHCSHCDVVTNTVLGQFKKKRKQHIVNTQNKKQKTEEDKIPHSHNLLCAYKRLLFYKHTLFASSFADVSVLHASLAAGKKKNKIQWTKHSSMYLHLQGIMIQCITIFFFCKKFLDSLLLRSTKWFLSPIVYYSMYFFLLSP